MPCRKNQKWSESDERIEEALAHIANGRYKSIHEVARLYNVSHVALCRPWSGGKWIAESREDQRHLSIPEENALDVDWDHSLRNMSLTCEELLTRVHQPPKRTTQSSSPTKSAYRIRWREIQKWAGFPTDAQEYWDCLDDDEKNQAIQKPRTGYSDLFDSLEFTMPRVWWVR